MTKIEPRLLKGFRDYGPVDQLVRQRLFSTIQGVFERYGFMPLSTPVLEYADILMGKYGEDEKLVYRFADNGGRDVAMRYDLTVPLARYVAQNQNELTFPFKRYQIAPVWRADNPQKGRLREFYQCDIDVVGTDSALADAEVIACLCNALEAIGIAGGYRVRINNRSVLAGLSPAAVRALDKIDKIGLDGITAEMIDNQVPQTEIDRVTALVSADSADTVPAEVAQVISLVREFGISGRIEFDPSIARGLDYYTGTVFEIFLDDQPEFGSICSGGRYDNLVDQFADKSLPAVGGSIGIDRLIDALKSSGLLGGIGVVKALILNLDERYSAVYADTASLLRAAGINTEIYYAPVKLDKQFKYAENKDIPFAVVIGEEEVNQNVVQLKDLLSRTQTTVTVDQLIQRLK